MIPANYDFPATVHTLNLAFNQFRQIPSTLISKPPLALTHLHLSGNKLRNLSSKFLMTGYTNLISLDLHTCQLNRCSPKLFERLSHCKNLRRLNLAINQLTDLPDEVGLLSQLQWLNLNDNLIRYLPDTMSDLTHLVKLGLVQNQIQVLPANVFLHMLELQKLDIRRNQLKYLPPSILALAPRQEVDVHVDLAVPHAVFQTLSTPVCKAQVERSCVDGHPYGGSLRTLLFYENPTVEHVDGILCDLGDEPRSPESVQAMSIPTAYSILRSNPRTMRDSLRTSLFEQEKVVVRCNDAKFKRSDHPLPNMLSEIDQEEELEENASEEVEDEDERKAIRAQVQKEFTSVLSLRELMMRDHLVREHVYRFGSGQERVDQWVDEAYRFIQSALPSTVVPSMMQYMALEEGRQCDYCSAWYTESRFQVGYLARLCNNRLRIPIRFSLCSLECTLDSVVRLYQTTIDWHTRQSLAHIDATLLLPSTHQENGGGGGEVSTARGGGEITNYWHVGLSQQDTGQERSPIHRTLGFEQGEEEVMVDEVRPEVGREEENNNARSASSSSSTLSTVSTLSCKSFFFIETFFFNKFTYKIYLIVTRQSSLARSIRNRVVQLASTIFNYHQDLSRAPRFLPLVFPETIVEEPPSVVSITTRIVEGRLQTERSQPQLRLATPTPSPTSFHHLPRDAIRLEKF